MFELIFIWFVINSDDNLPLRKTLKMYDLVTLVTSGLNDNIKFYCQVFLGAWLCKLKPHFFVLMDNE